MAGRPRLKELQRRIDSGELPEGTRLTPLPAKPQWQLPAPLPLRADESEDDKITRWLAEIDAKVEKLFLAIDTALEEGNAPLIRNTTNAIGVLIEKRQLLQGKATTRAEIRQGVVHLSENELRAEAERLRVGMHHQQEIERQRERLALESARDEIERHVES